MTPVFKKGELLNKMLVLATNRHAGQFDKGGNPYILHPLAVMHLLESKDEELQAIAVGHDIVEDTGVTYAELRELGFTERIIDGIKSLTKVPGESYDEYKAKVKANPDAVSVKMADLKHNTRIERLKGVTAKDMARMEKYFIFYIELCNLKQ
jgi:guanosine-3',5'-bis(diphosphate) 3'-pyrophosphohydrolase